MDGERTRSAATCYPVCMEIPSLLAKVTDTMHVSRSFGPPSQHGDVTLVPVAVVAGGGGGGGGTGHGDVAASAASGGGGGGGGFGTISWPIGAYVIEGGAVRWVPALDVTRLAVAGIGVVKAVTKLRARRQARRR